MAKVKRVERSKKELFERLISHLEILIELSDKAFYEYEHEKYFGDIAGKLRVLVIQRGRNKPLLLKLMDEFQYERKFEHQFDMATLRTFMYAPSLGSTSGEEKYSYTHEIIVRYLAEQMGSAHEDWEIDHRLHHYIYEVGARVNDSSWMFDTMRAIVNRVLAEAMYFLLYLHYENILSSFQVKYTLRQVLGLRVLYPRELCWSPAKREEKNIRVKPTRDILYHNDIEYLCGRADNFKYKIEGLTSKDEYVQNGPYDSYWMAFDVK